MRSPMPQIHPWHSCSPPTLMRIMVVARTQDAPLVPILSRLGLEWFLGNPSDNPLLHCQQLKLNTWLHAKLARRLSAWTRCCRSSASPCPHHLCCTWTTNQPSRWPNTLSTMAGWSSLTCLGSGCEMWWIKGPFHPLMYPLAQWLLICSQRHCLAWKWSISASRWVQPHLGGVSWLAKLCNQGGVLSMVIAHCAEWLTLIVSHAYCVAWLAGQTHESVTLILVPVSHIVALCCYVWLLSSGL